MGIRSWVRPIPKLIKVTKLNFPQQCEEITLASREEH
jgi:hypothetical protein